MKRPLALHLAVFGALIVVAVVTVLLLVWGRSDGAEPDRAAVRGGTATTPSTVTATSSPLVDDPKYRFVGEPLVYFHAPRPGQRNTRLRAMVRVVPRLPRRWSPEGPQRIAMTLDGAVDDSFGGLPQVGDECYMDTYDLSSAASGGPGIPPPPVFLRPRDGMQVTLTIEHREQPSQPWRSFSAHATIRRPPSKLAWDAFQRLGAKRLGCVPYP